MRDTLEAAGRALCLGLKLLLLNRRRRNQKPIKGNNRRERKKSNQGKKAHQDQVRKARES